MSIVFFPVIWLFKKLLDGIYACNVFIHAQFRKVFPAKPSTIKRDKVFDYIFYACFLAVPLFMFIVNNFVINGTSLILSFQEYDEFNRYLGFSFKNYSGLWSFMTSANTVEMIKRSLLVHFTSMVVCNIIPITFSFYVYKKFPGHNIFKIMLFLPSLFSGMITVSIFKVFCNSVIPKLVGCKALLLPKSDGLFGTLFFYQLWSGLGGGLLTHLAVMHAIDPSINESAQLDGVGFYGELWYIVLPSAYRVLTLGLITSWANIFGNTLNLFPFIGKNEPENANMLGHHIYVRTLNAAETNSQMEYGFLSAYGLMVTCIVTPLTLLTRYLINKYGPSEE